MKFHALSACVLVALLVCVSLSSVNGGISRITELYAGQCSRAKLINQCIQLVCAITAIGMSVSFDFFIRLVSSPTVEDLHKAHSRGQSLDVGIHSFRNLRQLSPWRMLCWVLLVATGIPIQLFFHSSTFIAYTSTAYSIFMVSDAFTTGAEFVYPGVAFMEVAFDPTRGVHSSFDYHPTKGVQSSFNDIVPGFRAASTNWTRLEVQDCLRTYLQDPMGLQSHRNVLLVVQTGPDADAAGWKGARVWNSTPPAYTNETIHEYQPEAVNSLWSFSAGCVTARAGRVGNDIPTFCSYSSTSWYGIDAFKVPWANADSGVPKAWNMTWKFSPYRGDPSLVFRDGEINPEYQTLTVKYCLSEPYSAPCKVFVSGPFLLISLLCVLLGSILSIVASSLQWRRETCQCLGDALKVFMIQSPGISRISGTVPIVWKDSNKRWGRVVSRRMWLLTYIPIVLFLVGGTACFCAFGSSFLK